MTAFEVPKENKNVAAAILAAAVREAKKLEAPTAVELDRIASRAIDTSPHIPLARGYDFEFALAVSRVWHFVRASLMERYGFEF